VVFHSLHSLSFLFYDHLVRETHGTSGQCVSFSLIDAGSVLLPAFFFISTVFPSQFQATNLLSATWFHAAVTGLTFCGPTFDDVAAVAYDTDELRVYKPLLPT